MNLIIYVPMLAMVQHSQCTTVTRTVWRPRVDVMTIDRPPTSYMVHYPSLSNIKAGRVVLINGYRMGTVMLALSFIGSMTRPKFPQYDMTHGDFYTNAYRWGLRAFSLIPEWLATASSYAESQKIWKKRYHYMEAEVPQWLRSILFFVDSWDAEKVHWKRYKLYTKPAFDKHLRYPSSSTNGSEFNSFKQTAETVENLDDSEAETVKPRSLNPWMGEPRNTEGLFPVKDG